MTAPATTNMVATSRAQPFLEKHSLKDNEEFASGGETYISRLVRRMNECLEQLEVDIGDPATQSKVQKMSNLIQESMSVSSRNFHSVQHVFDVAENLTDPVAILAALFHDCVYYNIDGGLSKMQAEKLKNALVEIPSDKGTILRIPVSDNGDELLLLVLYIFGLEFDQVMTPFTGLNEYLSAMICVRELKQLLPSMVLAELAICIEATIPFRPLIDGNTPSQRLFARTKSASKVFAFGWDDEACIRAVQRAVRLTNSDIGNFGSEDHRRFLDNTWSLLPESNVALRQQFLYTVREFQFAVFKMNGFFNSLKTDVVFQQFHHVPDDEELERLNRNCDRNLEVGRKYVGAKLLSTSFLAALSELSGGDAPISLFMGELPSKNPKSRRLEDSLPDEPPHCIAHCDPEVFDILAHGRRSETRFDVKKSPLAAYFYSFLGDEGLERILKTFKLYPMTVETAKSLLVALPRDAVVHVAEIAAELATPRRKQILEATDCLPSYFL